MKGAPLGEHTVRIHRKIATRGKRFDPPLSAAEVSAFESQHGVTLLQRLRSCVQNNFKTASWFWARC